MATCTLGPLASANCTELQSQTHQCLSWRSTCTQSTPLYATSSALPKPDPPQAQSWPAHVPPAHGPPVQPAPSHAPAARARSALHPSAACPAAHWSRAPPAAGWWPARKQQNMPVSFGASYTPAAAWWHANSRGAETMRCLHHSTSCKELQLQGVSLRAATRECSLASSQQTVFAAPACSRSSANLPFSL